MVVSVPTDEEEWLLDSPYSVSHWVPTCLKHKMTGETGTNPLPGHARPGHPRASVVDGDSQTVQAMQTLYFVPGEGIGYALFML